MGTLISHPRFAQAPVKNPRTYGRPKGTASFRMARRKRDSENAVFVCGHCGAPGNNCRCAGPPRPIPNPSTFTKRFERFLDVLVAIDLPPGALERLQNAFCDD